MASFQQVHIYAQVKGAPKPIDLGKFTTASMEANDKGGIDVVVYPHKRTLLRSEVRKVTDATEEMKNARGLVDGEDLMVTKWRIVNADAKQYNGNLVDWFEVTTVDA